MKTRGRIFRHIEITVYDIDGKKIQRETHPAGPNRFFTEDQIDSALFIYAADLERNHPHLDFQFIELTPGNRFVFKAMLKELPVLPVITIERES
jgi:hypothetical protein